MKRAVNLYLDERLLDAVDRVCKKLQREAGLPAKPNRSAVVACALESWLEEHGETIPADETD